jgi:deoxyribose-phosphate aldolase
MFKREESDRMTMQAEMSETGRPEAAAALLGLIDHTRLTFEPGEDEAAAIERLCREAVAHGFCAVCVRPRHIRQAKALLRGSSVKVATVIGFPAEKLVLADEQARCTVGDVPLSEKLQEVADTLDDGVDELDLVWNLARFKQAFAAGASDYADALEELTAIRQAAKGLPVKVIIETDLLGEAEIEQATRLCVQAGVAMVKTCTGMVVGGRGATPEIVTLIRKVIETAGEAEEIGIKASGGVKTAVQASALVQAGAARIGTSAGMAIAREVQSR